jgi:hypothetical protein
MHLARRAAVGLPDPVEAHAGPAGIVAHDAAPACLGQRNAETAGALGIELIGDAHLGIAVKGIEPDHRVGGQQPDLAPAIVRRDIDDQRAILVARVLLENAAMRLVRQEEVGRRSREQHLLGGRHPVVRPDFGRCRGHLDLTEGCLLDHHLGIGPGRCPVVAGAGRQRLRHTGHHRIEEPALPAGVARLEHVDHLTGEDHLAIKDVAAAIAGEHVPVLPGAAIGDPVVVAARQIVLEQFLERPLEDVVGAVDEEPADAARRREAAAVIVLRRLVHLEQVGGVLQAGAEAIIGPGGPVLTRRQRHRNHLALVLRLVFRVDGLGFRPGRIAGEDVAPEGPALLAILELDLEPVAAPSDDPHDGIGAHLAQHPVGGAGSGAQGKEVVALRVEAAHMVGIRHRRREGQGGGDQTGAQQARPQCHERTPEDLRARHCPSCSTTCRASGTAASGTGSATVTYCGPKRARYA